MRDGFNPNLTGTRLAGGFPRGEPSRCVLSERYAVQFIRQSQCGPSLVRDRFPGRPPEAFTLIELILVMALLTIIISVASPNLSEFFRGRALDTEAGRFLALTRYGQSRAVSAGTPMILWLHRAEGTYGLREEMKYGPTKVGLAHPVEFEPSLDRFNEEMPLEYQLAKDLRFELDPNSHATNNVAIIRFSADGSIDENSLKMLYIRDKNDSSIPILLTRTRLKYEIADKTNLWAGAFR
jgi:prepilin-type N-terminal cleavage/methylation domain-containing protein